MVARACWICSASSARITAPLGEVISATKKLAMATLVPSPAGEPEN
jgi:hypothetical protein